MYADTVASSLLSSYAIFPFNGVQQKGRINRFVFSEIIKISLSTSLQEFVDFYSFSGLLTRF